MPSSAAGWTYEICPRDEAERWLPDGGGAGSPLTSRERATLRGLATPKRRGDWLCGRLAAKRALAARLDVPEREIEVLADREGRPYCTLAAAPALSITHTAPGGLCAVSADARPIGVDWEMVAERPARVIELYTRPEERTAAVMADARAQTLIWAKKEAVLKLLGLGLAVPPTDLAIDRDGARLMGRAAARWNELGKPPLRLWSEDRKDSVIAVAYIGEH